jgi:hypothetical protein
MITIALPSEGAGLMQDRLGRLDAGPILVRRAVRAIVSSIRSPRSGPGARGTATHDPKKA